MNTKRIWELFPDIFKAIKKSHEEVGLQGHHDIYHAARVGDTAYQIALETWKDSSKAELAGIAGLCHNADRIIEAKNVDASKELITNLIQTWLASSSLDHDSCSAIIDAVLTHDQINNPSDFDILIALKDADRIINLDLDVIMRSGQYRPTLPTVDYTYFVSSPTANYQKPESIARDLASALEWVNPGTNVCIRTEIGLAMARERSEFVQSYLDTLKKQLEMEGIFPSPF